MLIHSVNLLTYAKHDLMSNDDIVQCNGRSRFCKDRFVGGRKIRRMNGNRNTDPKSHISTKGENTKRGHNGKGVLGKSRFFIKESNITD